MFLLFNSIALLFTFLLVVFYYFLITTADHYHGNFNDLIFICITTEPGDMDSLIHHETSSYY